MKGLCEKFNVLLIADEVQTGWGRTGYLLAQEHDMGGNRADITVIAKSCSGGVTPVSGILANDNIMLQIKPGEHGSTFGGNPLGMAVAKTAIEVLLSERMVENSRDLGAYMLTKLRELKSPLIKEVRGRGLFAGIELQHDLKVDGNDLAKLMLKRDMIAKGTHKHCMRISPPLVISQPEVN